MAYEERTETLSCSECGALHRAVWFRMPVKEWQSVQCRRCQHVMVSGNSTHAYAEPVLISSVSENLTAGPDLLPVWWRVRDRPPSFLFYRRNAR